MQITLTVNGAPHPLDIHPGELLRTALRRLRYFSVKHGDETGESGADAVLFTRTPDAPDSYRLLNAGVMLAAQADGASIVTVEGIGDPGSGIGDQGSGIRANFEHVPTNQPTNQGSNHDNPTYRSAFRHSDQTDTGYARSHGRRACGR